MNSKELKAEVFDIGYKIGKYPIVTGLTYDLETLTISFLPDADDVELEIVFNNPQGFRCLDEGDLLEFWEPGMHLPNCIFEIKSGGWFDQESQRNGFTSQYFGLREFLVTGLDDCVSVFCSTPPIVRVKSTESI